MTSPDSIAGYLRVIGRGSRGARALSREQACDLMSRLLGGHLSDLEKGGFALAMRIKGESPGELAGFMDAVHAQPSRFAIECASVARGGVRGPAVVLPSYNGSRRLPNLTPLLASLLARQGVPVLVHGIDDDPVRTTSAAIFSATGNPPVTNADELAGRWASRQPAFVSLRKLNPALAGLLDLRATLGVRNPGHTMAKLLLPWPGALRVINHTHPEYADSLSGYLCLTQASALLMRGTEGEPVADLRRLPALRCFVAGKPDGDLSVDASSASRGTLPSLADDIAAQATAAFTLEVLSGEVATPEPLIQQVRCLLALRRAVSLEREPEIT